ncbi:hypothetical protein HPB51_019273 [Rhipicephalus microplus]|uniref:Rhodanese domain-containing protein n=1 Tax=Rhipicephalus microplus TaxID=6941 RepID=A0A9J6EHW8_RHIMP|nr:hypothetical protein HPB51_019273 [Rhipicephalus microplus]
MPRCLLSEHCLQGMTMVPLEDLKVELCPRISPHDLLALLQVSRKDSCKMPLLVIDVRPFEEYQRGTIPGALNVVPARGRLTAAGVVVVAGSQKEHTAAVNVSPTTHLFFERQHASKACSLQVANGLVRSGQPRVCLLHGGIEVLRTVLELPS